jgi:hypothetical protein
MNSLWIKRGKKPSLYGMYETLTMAHANECIASARGFETQVYPLEPHQVDAFAASNSCKLTHN